MCKDCNRKSADNKALPGMQMPPEIIGAALSLFYEGASCASIRRHLWHIYHVQPSKSTIYNWWVEYTKKATELASDSKPKTGKSWVVNETVSKIGSENTWFWDVIDPNTKFLISSHVSDKRGTEDVEAVMKKAQDKTTEPPEFIIPDKLADYIEGIERVFGTDMWYKESQGFVGRIVTKPIAGSQVTLRDRAKIMNGLKSINTVKLATDGWLVHYNFFRPHPSLENKTPSEVARIKFPYSDWTDIVRGGKKLR
jgi:putative transposase